MHTTYSYLFLRYKTWVITQKMLKKKLSILNTAKKMYQFWLCQLPGADLTLLPCYTLSNVFFWKRHSMICKFVLCLLSSQQLSRWMQEGWPSSTARFRVYTDYNLLAKYYYVKTLQLYICDTCWRGREGEQKNEGSRCRRTYTVLNYAKRMGNFWSMLKERLKITKLC